MSLLKHFLNKWGRYSPDAIKKRAFGCYVCILVNINLSKRIFEEVVVELEGFAFCVDIVYDRSPKFCTNCLTIGHSISLCNKLHPKNKEEMVKPNKPKMKGDSSKRPITIEYEHPRKELPREMPQIIPRETVNVANDNTKEEDNDKVRSHEDHHEEVHIILHLRSIQRLQKISTPSEMKNYLVFGHYACIFYEIYWWNDATLLSNWKLFMIDSLIFFFFTLLNYWS